MGENGYQTTLWITVIVAFIEMKEIYSFVILIR